MKIEIARHDRMTESGSSLLRLIQNQDIPVLDLLIRESFQNSLDAGDSSNSRKNVRIDVSCKSFNSAMLNKHFDQITAELNKRYPDNKRYKSIVIADRGTVGLTGPMSYDEVRNEDFGNLLKLVYEISKPQTQEGAGGAWGLGKTVYYRVGMGLVIYYSRIRKGYGKFESRMAACLVENEKKKDQLIPSTGGLKRGIAWWGEERTIQNRKQTIPVTDEKEIKRLLDVFGIQPYADKETGTTVIIPYINEDALLQETYEGNAEAAGKRPPWTRSVEEYLRVAIQRWYAPRLNNPEYEGLSLIAWVGDVRIRPADMMPVFQAVREMYMCRTSLEYPAEGFLGENDAEVFVEDINVRGVLNNTAVGKLIYTKLNREQFGMTAPDNNPSPYVQVSNEDPEMEQGNSAIVMFTRKPGMIVGYDYSGSWTSRMPKTSDNEYIIGLFVLNSTNTFKEIKDGLTGNPLTVEEYVRQCEKADHASWGDKSIDGINPKLISKIQHGVNNKIAGAYRNTTPVITAKKNVGLSYALANLLLPNRGFGSAPGKPPRSGGGSSSGGGSGKKTTSLTIGQNVQFKGNMVAIPFLLELRGKACEIRIQISADYRKIDPENWMNETGQDFPYEYREIRLGEMREIRKNSSWKKISFSTDLVVKRNCGDLFFEGIKSDKNRKVYGFRVNSQLNMAIKGLMILMCDDKSMSIGFETKGVSE